ncbi:MAG: four helix bundle protein [Patescibacteria group bacterium]
MQNNNNLALYNKLYGLTKYNYVMVKNFTKEYKFTIGSDICVLSWACLDLLIEVNILKNKDKHPKLSLLSGAFDKLKLRIRLAQEIKLISTGQFAHLQENYLIEIGRMIGGFLNWAEASKE